MSNAERQKRYRDKKRNAPVTETVIIEGESVTRVTASVTPEQEGALRLECASGTDVPVEVGQGQVGHTELVPVHNDMHLVPDETVYGRQAVSYPGDTFETRPEPLHPTDTPDPRNRCIYQRQQDSTRYLLDATGNQHDRPQPKQVRQLSDAELQIRLKSYPGASWVNSPEHKEVMRRRGSNEQALQAAGACL